MPIVGAVLQAVATMSALTRLQLGYSYEPARESRAPRCAELSQLRSASLQDLTVFVEQVRD